MNLLGVPVRRSWLLFCLFSKGMSAGALSPLLIHLLPLVYVTDGDLGPRHLQSAGTPSDRPADPHREEDLFFLCTRSSSFFIW